jgi:hypothetical protein
VDYTLNPVLPSAGLVSSEGTYSRACRCRMQQCTPFVRAFKSMFSCYTWHPNAVPYKNEKMHFFNIALLPSAEFRSSLCLRKRPKSKMRENPKSPRGKNQCSAGPSLTRRHATQTPEIQCQFITSRGLQTTTSP